MLVERPQNFILPSVFLCTAAKCAKKMQDELKKQIMGCHSNHPTRMFCPSDNTSTHKLLIFSSHIDSNTTTYNRTGSVKTTQQISKSGASLLLFPLESGWAGQFIRFLTGSSTYLAGNFTFHPSNLLLPKFPFRRPCQPARPESHRPLLCTTFNATEAH